MKVPFSWLSQYIKLKHSYPEFGKIMTDLEFMQDGPIKDVDGEAVIDLEVRQNRPDVLSILGVAQEYAAFINEKVEYPEALTKTDIPVQWNNPDVNLKVEDTENVKRFCAVEIEDVKVKASPDWMKKHLESYGIPSINNIVDITNYVMLEYGMPLHAFDYEKLTKKTAHTVLTVRPAKEGEKFDTWQKTKLTLTDKDLVIADASKAVAIAGVIGGANSDIDNRTKHIILESACYNQAAVRRTTLRHSIRTEASLRHEKFLNPNMVDNAILRSLFLIKELAGGTIKQIEDFNPDANKEKTIIEFDFNEINRLGGIEIDTEDAINLLNRLGFTVLEHVEAIGIHKNTMMVLVPNWRTDIQQDADLVEEVLRLNGYDAIPERAISNTPPEFGTPNLIRLDNKIKEILVELGLYEQITSPFVKLDKTQKQVTIENPLNVENQALRTTITETLIPVVEYYTKTGKTDFGIFESGKVFYQKREHEHVEEYRIEVLYAEVAFHKRVKPDFMAVLSKLGLVGKSLTWQEKDNYLVYKFGGVNIAELRQDGYTLFLEHLSEIVNANNVPFISISTDFIQRIKQDISFIVENNQTIGEITDTISNASEYIKSITILDVFKDEKIGKDKKSVTLQIDFEDLENKLTRENIEAIKENFIKVINDKFKTELRN